MLSGISRRRKALVVAALMAGSALGAGVPVLVLPSSHDSAGAAISTITLRVTGIPGVSGSLDVTFAKLGGITYDLTPQPQPSGSHSKAFGNPVPPTITLGEPFATGIATYQDMMAWERAAREGEPAALENATLTLTGLTGTTIAEYVLEGAFPTNVDVAAGDPQSTSFTVELTGDELILESSSG
jgi:hypothetical protein